MTWQYPEHQGQNTIEVGESDENTKTDLSRL